MANTKQFEILFKMNAQIASSFKSGFNNANKSLNDMNKRTEALKKNIAGLQGIAQKGVAFGAVGLAGLGYAAKQAMAYEDELNNIGITASMTTDELKKLDKQAMNAAMGAGLKVEDVLKGAGDLVAKGMSKDVVGSMLGSLTNTVVASRAAMEDVANVTFTLNDALGVTADKMESVHGILITAGKAGAFEYNKMAQFIPNLGAKYKALGLEGSEAAASMGAALQIAYKGTGNADMAANNFQNFLSKISSPKMIKDASKMGFDMQKAMNEATAKGENPIDAVMDGIYKVTKGGKLDLLSQIASDQQVKDFLLPMMQNMPEYYKIKEEALNATNVVAMDSLKQGATAAASWGSFKNQLSNASVIIGQALTPAITELSQGLSKIVLTFVAWKDKNPELFNTLVRVSAVVLAVVGGVSALSLGIIAIIGPISVAVRMFASMGGAIFKLAGFIRYLSGCVPFIITIVKWMASGLWFKAIALIKLMGTTFMWLGRVFLMNPIGLIITAIVAAIAILYYNWDTVSKFMVTAWEWIKSAWSSGMSAISAFVSGAWESIKGFFTSGIGNITATILNFSPIALFYKAFAAVMSYFGVDMPSKFTDFGKFLIQGLINGISSMAGAVIDKAKAIASAVTETVKNAFGIHSPSKVFAQFGAFNMEGLANGMTAGAPMAQKASIEAVSGSMPSATGQSLTSNSTSNSSAFTINLTVNGGGSDTAEQAKSGIMDAMDQIKSMQQRERRLNLA